MNQKMADGRGAGRLTAHGHIGRVTAKGLNVVVYPLQRSNLILQA